MTADRVRLCARVVWVREYDADPAHYLTSDPAEMAAIDLANLDEDTVGCLVTQTDGATWQTNVNSVGAPDHASADAARAIRTREDVDIALAQIRYLALRAQDEPDEPYPGDSLGGWSALEETAEKMQGLLTGVLAWCRRRRADGPCSA